MLTFLYLKCDQLLRSSSAMKSGAEEEGMESYIKKLGWILPIDRGNKYFV